MVDRSGGQTFSRASGDDSHRFLHCGAGDSFNDLIGPSRGAIGSANANPCAAKTTPMVSVQQLAAVVDCDLNSAA